MSVRLVTTPWLTKNLAGGGSTPRRLLGGRRRRTWTAMVPPATAARRPTARHPAARPRIILAMLLALDIGNTNVTLGLFRAGALLATRRAATDARATTDELELLLDGLLRLDGIDARRPRRDRAGLGRAGADRRRSRRSPSGATGRCSSPAPGTVPLAIRVDRPAEVGADRLVNALAAARLHGTPAVVVDFGTATTLRLRRGRRRVCRRGDRAGPRARASRRSRHGPPSCPGSSCAPRTGRSAATR